MHNYQNISDLKTKWIYQTKKNQTLKSYFRHFTCIWVSTSKATAQGVEETHCANSGILECHGPGSATHTSGSYNNTGENIHCYSQKKKKKCQVIKIKKKICADSVSLTGHHLHCLHTSWWHVHPCRQSGAMHHAFFPLVGSDLQK